jgi:hypothetical protein
MRLPAIAAMASLERPFGLNAPGTVEMLPSTAIRENCGQHGCAIGCKRHTLTVAPIRQIDVLLDADAVKWPERKSIDSEDIGAELRQLIPERGQRLGLSRHGSRSAG